MDTVLSVLMLSFIVACCVYGVLAPHFKDNAFQCFGMGALAIWACGEIVLVIRQHDIGMGKMILYMGLFLFAAGTSIKVRRFTRLGNH